MVISLQGHRTADKMDNSPRARKTGAGVNTTTPSGIHVVLERAELSVAIHDNRCTLDKSFIVRLGA